MLFFYPNPPRQTAPLAETPSAQRKRFPHWRKLHRPKESPSNIGGSSIDQNNTLPTLAEAPLTKMNVLPTLAEPPLPPKNVLPTLAAPPLTKKMRFQHWRNDMTSDNRRFVLVERTFCHTIATQLLWHGLCSYEDVEKSAIWQLFDKRFSTNNKKT